MIYNSSVLAGIDCQNNFDILFYWIDFEFLDAQQIY